MTALSLVGWIAIGVLAAVSASQLLRIHGNAAVAVAQDVLPVVLLGAWIVGPLALVSGHEALGVASLVLVVYHVALIVPRLRRAGLPHWVADAPRILLGVANVYIDNRSPETAARQLVGSGADLLVVLESTPAFRATFDAEGGAAAYPHRVFDADDRSDYGVTIYAAGPADSMEMIWLGDLRAASIVVPCGPTTLRVLGVIPTAVVDSGGLRVWRRQMRAIAHHVSRVSEPMVVAGDLNTTTFRPGFHDLSVAGLIDAHESLGKGLKPSFKLAASGIFGRLGPVVRLDHALLNRRVRALDARDLDAAGSDHRPFLVTLAVHPSRAESSWSVHHDEPAPAPAQA